MSADDTPRPVHLGDGAYASFDGYQLWLAANHHENRLVALEPSAFRALVAYAKSIDDHYGVQRFGAD